MALRHKHKMQKRGQIMQIVFIIVLMAVLGFTLLIASKILSSFWTAVDDGGMTTAATNSTRVAFNAVPATFDYSMLFIMIGLTIGLVVTSFQIPSHPIFMVINFFGIFFLVWLAMTMSNMYGEMTASADSPFLVEIEQYPITAFIINYMPYICILLTLIMTVVMFAKGQSETPGGAY
jgi:hypothetical protein